MHLFLCLFFITALLQLDKMTIAPTFSTTNTSFCTHCFSLHNKKRGRGRNTDVICYSLMKAYTRQLFFHCLCRLSSLHKHASLHCSLQSAAVSLLTQLPLISEIHSGYHPLDIILTTDLGHSPLKRDIVLTGHSFFSNGQCEKQDEVTELLER